MVPKEKTVMMVFVEMRAYTKKKVLWKTLQGEFPNSLWYWSISIIAVQFNGRRCLLQGNVLINRRYLSLAFLHSGHDIESVEHQVAVQQ